MTRLRDVEPLFINMHHVVHVVEKSLPFIDKTLAVFHSRPLVLLHKNRLGGTMTTNNFAVFHHAEEGRWQHTYASRYQNMSVCLTDVKKDTKSTCLFLDTYVQNPGNLCQKVTYVKMLTK